jgi:hypothetical protein
MSFVNFLDVFLAMQTPVLPDARVMPWALHAAWAVVLGAATLGLLRQFKASWAPRAAALVALWTCVPGDVSPAFGLGLAFQSPSLMSVALCLSYVMRSDQEGLHIAPQKWGILTASSVLGVVGVALGWVLLLDTLAWWPVPVYALGFSPATLGWVLLLTLVVWVFGSGPKDRLGVAALLAAVVVFYVVTRLPSGNLWDALLDPWLWVILQARWLSQQVSQRLKASPGAATIRA